MPRVRADIVDVYVFRRGRPSCGPGGRAPRHPADDPSPAGSAEGAELLQIRRAREPMAGSWQPVMGHIEPGETAIETALRELAEEVGLGAGPAGRPGPPREHSPPAEPEPSGRSSVSGELDRPASAGVSDRAVSPESPKPATAPNRLVALYQLEQVRPFFLAGRDELVLSPRFAAEAAADWQPVLNAEHEAARWVPLAEVERAFVWPGQLAVLDELRRFILADHPARAFLRVWPGPGEGEHSA